MALLRSVREDFLSLPYSDQRSRAVELIDEAIGTEEGKGGRDR